MKKNDNVRNYKIWNLPLQHLIINTYKTILIHMQNNVKETVKEDFLNINPSYL